MQIVKVTKDFKILIPEDLRKKYNIEPEVEMLVEEIEGGIIFKKLSRKEIGQKILYLLHEGLIGVTTEEIDEERKIDRWL